MTDNERIERYLSTEWAVTADTAKGLATVANSLTAAVEFALQQIVEAEDSGDVHALSAATATLSQILTLTRSAVERVEGEAYAQYVELLGTRDEVKEMAEALYDFFEPPPAREPDAFDKLLENLNGKPPA